MKMKALVYHGDHKIALETVDKPVILKPTDAIVKVTKTTICGTDLGIYKGKNPEVADGRILGHRRHWNCWRSRIKCFKC